MVRGVTKFIKLSANVVPQKDKQRDRLTGRQSDNQTVRQILAITFSSYHRSYFNVFQRACIPNERVVVNLILVVFYKI